jgi:hypothetical protein
MEFLGELSFGDFEGFGAICGGFWVVGEEFDYEVGGFEIGIDVCEEFG